MNIKSKIESLLFISAKPIAIKELAVFIEQPLKEVEAAGEELVNDYKTAGKGIEIIKNGSKLQMVSSPHSADVVGKFIQNETSGELSRPSLETLTIIAYRGPISKLDLDRIRGINCSLIVRNLLIRGLIEYSFDKTKNETYYTVTFDFIRFLGISKVEELPDYERLHKDDTIERALEA
jgi:segregation and condensation protein B